MFNKQKKLNEEDFEEIKERNRLINQHTIIIRALKFQHHAYMKELLIKYGLDLKKNYQIDPTKGLIIEVKKPIK